MSLTRLLKHMQARQVDALNWMKCWMIDAMGIMDFGYDADDIDDGMKAAAIIALMRIIYGKDDDPREPASVLMMTLIEIEIQTLPLEKRMLVNLGGIGLIGGLL